MQSDSEQSKAEAAPETFAGVSLVQLASVAALRAEGFSLEEVLNAEGLQADEYRAADIEYKRRLVEPNDRDRMAANYSDELARAEDRLGRKVSPLEEDVDAWVRFLDAYGKQSAPADWLVTLGLTPPDLSRLSRMWKRRFERDEGLRKKAEKSVREKKPYDPSSLQIVPAQLIPSPLAKPIKKSFTETEAAPVPNDKAKPFQHWMPRIDVAQEPELAPSIAPLPQASFDMPVPVAAPAALIMTTPQFSLPSEEVLPFVAGTEQRDESTEMDGNAVVDVPAREALSGTSLAVEIPRGPAIPFAKSKDLSLVPEKPIISEKRSFVPKLSLENHAAMTVEIATYPAHALAILQRYGLTPPEKVDLDRHYQQIVANDPARQAAWHAAYGAHYGTLMQAHRR